MSAFRATNDLLVVVAVLALVPGCQSLPATSDAVNQTMPSCPGPIPLGRPQNLNGSRWQVAGGPESIRIVVGESQAAFGLEKRLGTRAIFGVRADRGSAAVIVVQALPGDASAIVRLANPNRLLALCVVIADGDGPRLFVGAVERVALVTAVEVLDEEGVLLSRFDGSLVNELRVGESVVASQTGP
jgi:hypothetical protein